MLWLRNVLSRPVLRYASARRAFRHFIPPQLDEIEDLEGYRPGGYHPISIGDVYDHGRFRVLHKLGSGGSATVWLARDKPKGGNQGRLVALKAMHADLSSAPPIAIPHTPEANVQTTDHQFTVQGPNGTHLFLASPLAGPSVRAMSDSPGRVAGTRRLRADLARKVAKQTATALQHLHHIGVVHGDLTTSNILFRLSPHTRGWSDAEVYAHFGEPELESVRTCDGRPPGPHAPPALVAAIPNTRLCDAPRLLLEHTVLADFGQSFFAHSPPPSYVPRTTLGYQSPEARFEARVGLEADIWALACAIFEIRAGFALFEAFLGSEVDVLKQTVEMLGRLPEPWWGAFEERSRWFEQDGRPRSELEQERSGVLLIAYPTSIREKLREIGAQDDDDVDYMPPGPMFEKRRVGLSEAEVELMADLLEKMLRYKPEERIRIGDVVRHPWFML
ncbi:kinase-like protein [Coprinopsis marcescibilis]|uniref:non-specific serine/threonine protein kinase n=1 Tax=Coprinopsis marcescibilis TaxID=230819 RepID=A0A5C3LG35_COPMA|nr:kinase-like protein [Coprinopsis marcescibilis]